MPRAFTKNLRLSLLGAMIITPLISAADNQAPSVAVEKSASFDGAGTEIYNPRFTFNAQNGSHGYYQLDYMYSFLRRADAVFFVDGRGTLTSQSYRAVNLGLGHRSLVFNDNFIAGQYIWYDRARSTYKNYYNQITVGGELLGKIYDFRANVYIPYGKMTQQLSSTFNPYITGYTIGVYKSNRIEQALLGQDIEIGRVIPKVPKLHVFADYYHFGMSDDVKINGVRARAEYRFTPNAILTASYAYDNAKHSTAFAGIRLSLDGVENTKADAIRSRMEEFIIRDDLHTATRYTSSGLTTSPAKVIFVNNTSPAGGNGTFEHPFNVEQAAVDASASGNIIYTFQGNGVYPLTPGGTTLLTNQLFTGSGGDFIFNNTVILPATTAPVLNGRLNVATGDTLSNFSLSGAGSADSIGIAGTGVANVTLSNLTIANFSGTAANGADASGNGAQVGGNGGNGGNAAGIQIQNSTNISLNNITVTGIGGGSANGGNATSQAQADGDAATGGAGGVGGNAIGIDLLGSIAALNNVSVLGINGGAANGGNASMTNNAGVSTNAFGGVGNTGGNATAINLTNATVSLSHVTVTNVVAGSAQGGDGINMGPFVFPGIGGDGGFGGNAVGINETGATLNAANNVAISGVVAGTADGGTGSTVQGTPGTPGTANNTQ
jgi:hypothetical protein